jgi:hypothetical protein
VGRHRRRQDLAHARRGRSWQDVTPAALTGWSKVGIIDASHFDGETAYAAVDRHRLDDFKPYVYRTHDGGRSWQAITRGIPNGSFVNAVREDSVRRGLLYAATERGVYVSFDDGDRWQALQINLPVTSVRDLLVQDNDLVIATHGRGFWILDDVSPLRQAETGAPGERTRLLKPSTAIRLRPLGFGGTPMPKDEPMGTNPPEGAYLDYVLAARAKTAVALELRDAQGGVVASYSSDQEPPKDDPAKITTAPEWLKSPQRLGTTPGMHRFVWNMRYAAPAELLDNPNDRNNREEGVWAPPGSYRVILRVDGKEFAQTLELAPDPRIELAASAYAEQFALARKIERDRVAIAKAGAQASEMLKAVAERRGKASGAAAAALDAFEQQARAVTGTVRSANPSNTWWIPPRTVQSLRSCGEALERLADAADHADAAPSPDARSGYAQATAMATATLEAWRAFVSKDLAELNRTLSEAGMDPIPAGSAPAS